MISSLRRRVWGTNYSFLSCGACASLKESLFPQGAYREEWAVGYTRWSVSQSHPLHQESLTNHIHSISISQTSGCDWPICQLITTNLARSLCYFWDFWLWRSDRKSHWKIVKPTKPSRFLISNITIRSSNFCYQKIFLEEVYTLDRFAFEVCLSVYIFQPSIVRKLKVRLLRFDAWLHKKSGWGVQEQFGATGQVNELQLICKSPEDRYW